MPLQHKINKEEALAVMLVVSVMNVNTEMAMLHLESVRNGKKTRTENGVIIVAVRDAIVIVPVSYQLLC